MKLVVAALLVSLALDGPSLSDLALDRALRNYRALVEGRKQLPDFPLQERAELLELDRWLQTHARKGPETVEKCKERLTSSFPSALEEALLDLKCSQRPSHQKPPPDQARCDRKDVQYLPHGDSRQ